MPKKISKEEWELRINEVGAGRYEFLRWAVDGEFGCKKKCVVRCIKDGYAWESRVNDLVDKGNGCPQCSGNRIWTAEERIEQINKIDNLEFVCWVGSYRNASSKAKVRCAIDGFEWSATVHHIVNTGSGCPQCAGNRRWTAEERIEQINKLENIEFVSWVDGYKNTYSKVNLKCTIDGFEWVASVNDIVNGGTGCAKCANHGYDKSKTGTLYALRSECGQHVKVGISNEPRLRYKILERKTPFSFIVFEQASGDGTKIASLEKYFHNKYERAGLAGFDGCTEWLICTPELLEELRNLGDK